MARNEEKHAGRLNRLWLQRLDEENAQKNPPRPGLGSLHTAEQVKKWMPSIKKDIDFYLKQSQVGCYPERKIAEFSEKIEGLTKEYKAYLRKYRELEGDRDSTPWSDKPYSRKHKTTKEPAIDCDDLEEPLQKLARNSEAPQNSEKTTFVPISLPVLEKDICNADIYTYNIVNTEVPAVSDLDADTRDKPLEFNWNKNMKALEYHSEVEKDCLSDQLQNEPLNFQWRKNDSSGCSRCSDKCSKCPDECFKSSSGCLKHSSEGSDSLKKCPKNLYEFPKELCKCSKNLCTCCKNLCRCTNCDGCRKTINDNLLNEREVNFSNSGMHQTKSRETFAENINVLDSTSTYVPGSATKDKVVNKDIGNVLNLPYSDSSSDEDNGK
ncbi:uncharacterized protein LOC128555846 [Mercenaria mercenaria]|uniref:uncharacterized protein LOC128555846 n=1 Tax=Mercenaria mercenaria TaxID=6596 RepID=UPI00234F4FC3|nr:uncharacterized protein LOC128555846 [Mercenaria mercenaria]